MKKYYLLLPIILTLLSGCKNTTGEDTMIKTIEVAPYLVDCVGVAPMKCLKIKEQNQPDWQLLYQSIDGFNFEEGYQYQLQVKVTEKLKPIPADSSSLQWTLIKVINKKIIL